jgi:hypothetical protein
MNKITPNKEVVAIASREIPGLKIYEIGAYWHWEYQDQSSQDNIPEEMPKWESALEALVGFTKEKLFINDGGTPTVVR